MGVPREKTLEDLHFVVWQAALVGLVDGGHAGGGGGGQGGISFDIFISNSNSVTQTYLEDNLLPIPADEETAGIGGIGGNSSNTVIGTGQDGQTGLAGHFAKFLS